MELNKRSLQSNDHHGRKFYNCFDNVFHILEWATLSHKVRIYPLYDGHMGQMSTVDTNPMFYTASQSLYLFSYSNSKLHGGIHHHILYRIQFHNNLADFQPIF